MTFNPYDRSLLIDWVAPYAQCGMGGDRCDKRQGTSTIDYNVRLLWQSLVQTLPLIALTGDFSERGEHGAG